MDRWNCSKRVNDRLIGYFTLQDDIRNAGGKWQDKETLSMAPGLQQKTGRHPGI